MFKRLRAQQRFKKARTIPVPPAVTSDFPLLAVFVLREQMLPDGDSNAAAPEFVLDVTIGVSIARAYDLEFLDGLMDRDVALVESLFTDPTFVRREPGCLFESIESVLSARLFPPNGETYFGETRVEIVFRTRCGFDPVITDQFAGVNVTSKQVHPGLGQESIALEIDANPESEP